MSSYRYFDLLNDNDKPIVHIKPTMVRISAGVARQNHQALLASLASFLGNPRRACYFALGLLTLVYSVERTVSQRRNNVVYHQPPINYIERPCPSPDYELEQKSLNAKICITTLTDAKSADVLQRLVRWRNFDHLLEMTWPNKQNYASKHSYHLFDESRNLDRARPPSWSKIKAARRLLTEEKCDWVMWLDADTVVMNSSKRIQDFWSANHDLVITEEKNGSYNAGAWLIRNSRWSLEFLDNWWNMTSFVKAKGLSVSGDNDALKWYLTHMDKNEFRAHIAVPSRCAFNSVTVWLTDAQHKAIETGKLNMREQDWYMSTWKYHKGDFIAHVAGK